MHRLELAWMKSIQQFDGRSVGLQSLTAIVNKKQK